MLSLAILSNGRILCGKLNEEGDMEDATEVYLTREQVDEEGNPIPKDQKGPVMIGVRVVGIVHPTFHYSDEGIIPFTVRLREALTVYPLEALKKEMVKAIEPRYAKFWKDLEGNSPQFVPPKNKGKLIGIDK